MAAVRRQWNLAGHAVDEIQEDYGEDLLVQICFEGRMDPARVWVQVKGTEKDTAKRLPRVSVKSDQVLRWARTADLVVAVLWDVTRDRGWFTLPQDQFDHVDLAAGGRSFISLEFASEVTFDQTAVEKLAWAARIEHANRSVVYARAGLTEALEMDLETNKHFYKGVLASTIFDFAVTAKIFKPSGGFSDDFPFLVGDFLREQDPTDLTEATSMAMIAAVFAMIHENCAESGAPLALVKEICAVVHPLMFGPEAMALLDAARRPREP
ncbi:DUF4365 domain-containing protein [Streptomyces sp. NPDC054958]